MASTPPTRTLIRRNAEVRPISAFFPCYNELSPSRRWSVTSTGACRPWSTTSRSSSSTTGPATTPSPCFASLQDEICALRIVEHEHNRGYGGALLSGFDAAKHEWVFYTDGDAQYDASELARCIDAVRPDVDIVQGYKLGRRRLLVPQVIGRAYHHTVRLLFGSASVTPTATSV